MNLLIADDENLELRVLEKTIKKYFIDELKIFVAGNGRNAVQICDEVKPDIALLDIEMPGMNGIELAKYIKVPLTMDFMSVSSYGNGTESSGRVRIVKDLDEGIDGKDVLLIEDIIDSGHTLSFLQDMLWTKKPNSLKLCTLLDKPDRRVVEGITVDYVGFVIPDEFVVGYGLDYMQRYRNLPYIGVVHLD